MARQKSKLRNLWVLAAILLIMGIANDGPETEERLQREEPPQAVFVTDEEGNLQLADLNEDQRTLELFGFEVVGK